MENEAVKNITTTTTYNSSNHNTSTNTTTNNNNSSTSDNSTIDSTGRHRFFVPVANVCSHSVWNPLLNHYDQHHCHYLERS
ncbi:ras guanine nucleotide exchange factor E-like [Toxotes jaculatrix]|uniref:ras guanine nucleotide exchange factor E-like n=1 Tax=Toxotes jaculatrix TaxID=941984 RepID=UPI001B3B084D|nr:ras guanine nucleotide exchange factor E-like [Toxotes jaculatrix]